MNVKLADAVNPEGLKAAFNSAVAEQETVIRQFTDMELTVALQRKWHLVFGNPVPDTLVELERVVPSEITELERYNFIAGSLEEAKRRLIFIINTSWTKTEFRKKLAEEGLSDNVFEVWDEPAKTGLRNCIRLLTD